MGSGIFSENLFGGMGQTTDTTSTTPSTPAPAPDSLISSLVKTGGSSSSSAYIPPTDGKTSGSVSPMLPSSTMMPASTTNYTPFIIGGVALVVVAGAFMMMGRGRGSVTANRRRGVKRNRRRHRRSR